MGDKRYIYEGPKFDNPDISIELYKEEFFNKQIELESDLFYNLRKSNGIKPYSINQSTEKELQEIKNFFLENKSTFFFLFDGIKLIGSIMVIDRYIQVLCVSLDFQRQGYGKKLTQFAVNYILARGHSLVEVDILNGNISAEKFYENIGFKEKI